MHIYIKFKISDLTNFFSFSNIVIFSSLSKMFLSPAGIGGSWLIASTIAFLNLAGCEQAKLIFATSLFSLFNTFLLGLPVVLPIIDKLGVPLSKVRRIKGNLSTRTQRRYNHQVHYDYQPNSPWISLCYYVNSTNGPTVFDNKRWIKRKVKSKRNRLARFDGSHGHHSTTPTDANYRITINIDYEYWH